ncbi:hypothetical protein E4U40_005067 [Claviceps sp. LM458 group G5]|nr:hypothetical protein E4U40_005067 [Claviceps sp. LM458 group G5]
MFEISEIATDRKKIRADLSIDEHFYFKPDAAHLNPFELQALAPRQPTLTRRTSRNFEAPSTSVNLEITVGGTFEAIGGEAAVQLDLRGSILQDQPYLIDFESLSQSKYIVPR